MPKLDLISALLDPYHPKLSLTEKFLLENNLLVKVFSEIKEVFIKKYHLYHQLVKSAFTVSKEENMKNIPLITEMVKDILETKEYSLSGIATYAHVPEEVLYDLAAGINTEPSFEITKKILELHISVRKNLYEKIMHRIAIEYLEKSPIKN